jgi:hypothetical protein
MTIAAIMTTNTAAVMVLGALQPVPLLAAGRCRFAATLDHVV